MTERLASEAEFDKQAARLFLGSDGRAKSEISLKDFEAMRSRFKNMPNLNERLVAYCCGSEAGVEVHGVRKGAVEIYLIDRFHGRLYHMLAELLPEKRAT
jgi:hypothetical protein